MKRREGGKILGNHLRTRESSATRAREASSFAMHSDLTLFSFFFLYFYSCLQDESLRDSNSTSTRVCIVRMLTRGKIVLFGALLNCFAFLNFSPFLNLGIVHWRPIFRSILIQSRSLLKNIPLLLKTSSEHERARPAYVAVSFPPL